MKKSDATTPDVTVSEALADMTIQRDLLQETANSLAERMQQLREQKTDLDGRLKEQIAETEYARECQRVAENNLERAKGYIDRVLDQEADYDSGKPVSVTPPPPEKGPPLDPRPARRRTDGYMGFEGAMLRPGSEPRRRY